MRTQNSPRYCIEYDFSLPLVQPGREKEVKSLVRRPADVSTKTIVAEGDDRLSRRVCALSCVSTLLLEEL